MTCNSQADVVDISFQQLKISASIHAVNDIVFTASATSEPVISLVSINVYQPPSIFDGSRMKCNWPRGGFLEQKKTTETVDRSTEGWLLNTRCMTKAFGMMNLLLGEDSMRPSAKNAHFVIPSVVKASCTALQVSLDSDWVHSRWREAQPENRDVRCIGEDTTRHVEYYGTLLSLRFFY
ncbi:hypothetical protein JB92DRAFT_2837654 [Gautieria morchelliformis]|nr:hypothetical protein JB92DRAFT_2837654 [Gautieria morchelliformis]